MRSPVHLHLRGKTVLLTGGTGFLGKVIVERALDLLDEVGMDGLSTRRLAAELGVKGPSLYWHFKNMRELFNHMAEALRESALPAPDAFPHDWQAWLADGARGLRVHARW